MEKSKTNFKGDEVFHLFDTYVKIGVSPFTGKYCLMSERELYTFDDVEQLLDEFRHRLPELKDLVCK